MGNIPYDGEVLRSLAKANPLLILDNVPGKQYYPVFDNYYFEDKKIPLIAEYSWSMGGGAGDVFTFVIDNARLYLPTIVINGVISGLSFELAKKVFKIFKSKIPRKRQTVIYYSQKEEVTYYEFSSDTSGNEFNQGLDDIPTTARKAKSQSYFVRSNKKWILEDKS